jgi:hypothetical protein
MALTAIKPTRFVTPDGVEREIRYTFGAQKRFFDRFSKNLIPALQEHSQAEVLPFALWACLYDANGKPPADLTLETLSESLNPGDDLEILSVLMEAMSQGSIEKKTIRQRMEAVRQKEIEALIGSSTNPSPSSDSESASANSGNSPTGSTTDSADTSTSESEPQTSDSEQSLQT